MPQETDDQTPEPVTPGAVATADDAGTASSLPADVEITLDLATVRRRQRDEKEGLEMLSHLERQASEILALADATERGEGPQRFAGCRAFRVKLGEFEAFCSVIEDRLRKLAGDAQGELEHLFHKHRITILRPSIKALTAMFIRLAREGLPFGFLTVLDEELRALQGMREMVTGSKDLLDDDRAMLEKIDKLEALMQSLRGKATDFVEFTA
jgi:hypothetical protein